MGDVGGAPRCSGMRNEHQDTNGDKRQKPSRGKKTPGAGSRSWTVDGPGCGTQGT